MIEIGKFNVLKARRGSPQGMYLCDDEGNEVLLPAREEPVDLLEDDELRVFIYRDSEDRLTATLQQPLIIRDTFARLQVKSVNKVGAFLDWGLSKDLLVPFAEQRQKMTEGNWYLVYMYLDEKTDRLVASGKVGRFLDNSKIEVKEGDEADLIVMNRTDLGVNVIINQLHLGLVFNNDLVRPLQPGERLKGFIKRIKPENKIDVSLQRPGYAKVPQSAETILDYLRTNDGFLALSDKSTPEEILEKLAMSKKTFKKAVGALYKQRLIIMTDAGIRLKEVDDQEK